MLLLRVQHIGFLTDCLDFISTITERSQIKIFIESDTAVQHSLVTQANSAANSLPSIGSYSSSSNHDLAAS